MADVFISYKREEQANVRAIAAALEANGYSVWWDPQLELSTTSYPKQIWEALQNAKAVIVVWSTRSIESDWVTGEATEARRRQTLVQVRINAVDLRPPFNMLECADLSGWTGAASDANWSKALARVRSLCGSAKGGGDAQRFDVNRLHPLVAEAVREARLAEASALANQEKGQRAAEAAELSAARARAGAFGTHSRTYDSGVYEGEGFVDSQGTGVWKAKGGAVFKGDFESGSQSGYGVVMYAADEAILRYEGQYFGGRPNGCGVTTWRDGDRYFGRHQQGAPSAFGVFHWQKGGRYEGEISNWAASGFGVNWDEDGLGGAVGRWENGKLVEAMTR
ncbi:MAG: TIR domain-containing protein [Proteobacteria bacterium]|nr:TIR domain-containing protein [Pseudomonadota bacterium]